MGHKRKQPKIIQFTYNRRYSWLNTFTVDGSTQPEVITVIRRIPRHTDLKPKQMQIWFGIQDDPSDEVIEYYLNAVDPQNVPSRGFLREQSAWLGVQAWRSIGTDSGPIQTAERDELEFPRAPTYSNRTDRTQSLSLCILARSTVSSVVIVAGSIEVEITIDRRIWPGEDWPEDIEFEEWDV